MSCSSPILYLEFGNKNDDLGAHSLNIPKNNTFYKENDTSETEEPPGYWVKKGRYEDEFF